MKIRIQDNSIRLRMTLREVEAFAAEGVVSKFTQIVTPAGLGPRFDYRLEFDTAATESTVDVEPSAIRVRLAPCDRMELLRPDVEGVYIRREWISPSGEVHRFMAFVEKDRPGSTCVKKEQWIYDAPPHGPVETRQIPKAVLSPARTEPGDPRVGTIPKAVLSPARTEPGDPRKKLGDPGAKAAATT